MNLKIINEHTFVSGREYDIMLVSNTFLKDGEHSVLLDTKVSGEDFEDAVVNAWLLVKDCYLGKVKVLHLVEGGDELREYKKQQLLNTH